MILGIETSTPRASLALRDVATDTIVWSREFTTDRAHNAVIFSPIEEMLSTYRSELSGIVVGLGPGSYSGIRVGIAVANGLGLALGIPTLGVSSLEAWDVDADSHVILGDARRRSLFVAEVAERKLIDEPQLIDVDKAGPVLTPLYDRGLPCYTADRRVTEMVENVELAFPAAERLPLTSPGSWPAAMPLEPHYLRAPYITTPKQK